MHGYGGGSTDSSGKTEDVSEANHAWNAVQVKGEWFLVDTTWDAGSVQGREFHKGFHRDYLFPNPRHFLHNHLPTESKWQLIDPPITAEKFANLPNLGMAFFANKLQLQTPLSRITSTDHSTEFVLHVPRNVIVFCSLYDPDGEKIKNRTLIQREGSRCRILVSFPEAGLWKLSVFARPRESTASFGHAAALFFDSSGGTSKTFPRVYLTYSELDGALLSPLHMPLSSKERQKFKVRVVGTDDVYLLIGETLRRLEPHPTEEDVFELVAQVPDGEPVQLQAKRKGNQTYWTLVDYSGK